MLLRLEILVQPLAEFRPSWRALKACGATRKETLAGPLHLRHRCRRCRLCGFAKSSFCSHDGGGGELLPVVGNEQLDPGPMIPGSSAASGQRDAVLSMPIWARALSTASTLDDSENAMPRTTRDAQSMAKTNQTLSRSAALWPAGLRRSKSSACSRMTLRLHSQQSISTRSPMARTSSPAPSAANARWPPGVPSNRSSF